MKTFILVLGSLLCTAAMAGDKQDQSKPSETPVVHTDGHNQEDGRSKAQEKRQDQDVNGTRSRESSKSEGGRSSDSNDRDNWPSMPSGYF